MYKVEGCWDPRSPVCQQPMTVFLWTGVQKRLCLGYTCCWCQVVIFGGLSLTLSLFAICVVQSGTGAGGDWGGCCWFIKLPTARRVWETLLLCSEDENSERRTIILPSTSCCAVHFCSSTYVICLVVVYDWALTLTDPCVSMLSFIPNQVTSPSHSHNLQATPMRVCIHTYAYI